ncbi:MAG: bis(5'-nucleosyl)-tetraphosphatase (symmetrical) YqeK [Clostridia bacterium]|nr:bis(5'-nucleosyl)-tetraphosphatase (symmetrical) YqeK [Clostridia bacterium]
MFDEKSIDILRAHISSLMSGYRLEHTLGVESMAAELGELYAPEKIDILRAAALLHDITKENSFEKQLQICEKLGIIIPSAAKAAPKTLHAITAAAVIPSEYPLFAMREIIDAVRWHTTGREDMSICEKIIYLADYIEYGRKFDDCIRLREYFFEAKPEQMNESERLIHLDKTLVLSFDMTISQLINEGALIDPSTTAARNFLILSLSGSTDPIRP